MMKVTALGVSLAKTLFDKICRYSTAADGVKQVIY